MLRKLVFLSAMFAVGICSVTGQHLVVLPDGMVDLGEFEAKESQTREVYIKNTGDKPLTLHKVFSTCSCTRVKYSSSPIAPGDSTAMTLLFDGHNLKPGAVRKVIRIMSNADNSVVGVLIQGQIVRPFQK